MKKTLLPLLAAIVAASSTGFAQGPPDPQVLIAAQREGMAPLAYMNGVWRGPATTTLPSGEVHNITQTERIGPFLDGRPPVRFFQMNLVRVRDSDWPGAGAIGAK